MAKTRSQVATAEEKHGYEFFGPYVFRQSRPQFSTIEDTNNAVHSPGAFVITTFLPPTAYAFALLCNDKVGCPASPLLHPSTLTLDKLKEELGWEGLSTIFTWEAFFANLGWYALSLVLDRVLPATHVEGIALRSGGKLKYRFNGA